MTMNLPEIRIKNAWLLRDNASEYLNELWGKGESLRSDKEYIEIVNQYKNVWEPVETQILTHICEQLGLQYRQNIIDVYIAPWFYAFSDPMVLGVTFTAEEFVDNLTHELIHRLLTDNTSFQLDYLIADDWEKLFGKDHTFNTLVHIPVHAVHKSVYLDLLKSEERYEHDKAIVHKNGATDYVKSWSFVDSHDYVALIKSLREQYAHLSQDQA